MNYTIENIDASNSVNFLTSIYNLLNDYTNPFFDELEYSYDGENLNTNILSFKKDGRTYLQMKYTGSAPNTSSNSKLCLKGQDADTEFQFDFTPTTATSQVVYLIKTPYNIIIAQEKSSAKKFIIFGYTQNQNIGIAIISTGQMTGYTLEDNTILGLMNANGYANTESTMTQMLPILLPSSLSGEYLPYAYALVRTQGISMNFREVKLGVKNFVTDGTYAFEI